jgi:hypothetical protein
MLRLLGGQVESLWDEVLPERLRVLPDDLAQIDGLLRDEALLAPVEAHWEREAEARGRSAKGHGRPTIAIQTYLRLMVLKHRHGWGYETLMREVSDFPSAPFLPDRDRRAGAGRVDGQEADPQVGARDGRGAVAVGDREGAAGDTLPGAGGQDRLDGGRGGRAPSDRFQAGRGRGADARPGGETAGGAGRRRGCGTAHARSADGCARSDARCGDAQARRRRRCWR